MSLRLCDRRGRVEVTKLLLEAGAEISIKNFAGASPLQYAASHDEPGGVLELLIEHRDASLSADL